MAKDSTFLPSYILLPEVKERIRSQPECQLLWAVLEEAISTYMKYATATSRRGQRFFSEAEDWIFQNNSHWLFSFINICHILDIDPSYLRTGLLQWRASQCVRVEHEAA